MAARLDTTLQEIRKDRRVTPPMFTCSECCTREDSAFVSISVNAAILAAGSFGVVSELEIKNLSKRWHQYRRENNLDQHVNKISIGIYMENAFYKL
jgi:transcription elongation factor Elf1